MRPSTWLVIGVLGCGKEEPGPVAPEPSPPSGSGCFALADGSCVEQTFANPPVLAPDAEGVHHLELAASEVELDGQRHCARVYNGMYPGPTIETPARDGDTPRQVRVNLVNAMTDHAWRDLGGEDCTCTDAGGAACLPEHVHDPCDDGSTDTCACTNAEGEACHMFDFNTTNLHAHGSHVRPDYARGGEACEPGFDGGVYLGCRDCDADVCDGDASDDTCFRGDDVLNTVHWGEGTQYRWDLDEDGTHHTGLQWYHPHIHGTTAIQVGSGAAGAWIVRGDLDALDGIADATERVMVISTPSISGEDAFQPLADGTACTDETLTFDDFSVLSNTFQTQTTLINSARRPRLIAPPDQVERWRILHAGFLDEMFLGVLRGTDSDCSSWDADDRLSLVQIGRDGLILPQTWTDDYLFLSPGYRIEAMLGGEGALRDGDTWCLVGARFLDDSDPSLGEFGDQPLSPTTAPSREDLFARFATDGDLVGILNVTASAGPATETELPDEAAIAALAPSVDVGGVDIDAQCADAAAEDDPEAMDQAAVLQVGFWTVDDPDPCDCAAYNVNCNNFEETDRSLYPVDRDLVLGEVDHWRVQASIDGHPFHIHINPYVVCPNENIFDPIPFPHWRDTYLVNLDRKIDLITENRAFTGNYVFHCHKLTHEDHGMMEVVRVCDPATDPTCGDYHWRACDPEDLACLQALAATDCALATESTPELGLCVQALAGPGGMCSPLACATDADCAAADRCEGNTCVPAPCPAPCPPGEACEHGECV